MDEMKKQLEELQKGKSTRVVQSLDKLNQILETLFLEGNKKYTISHIGRLSKASGGVSEISIRNKSGEHYRQLIEYWKNKAELKSNMNPIGDLNKFADKEIDIINKNVENIAARNFIYTIIAERNKLRKVVKTQEKIIKANVTITSSDLGNELTNTLVLDKNFNLDVMEINVLKDSIEFDFNLVRKFWEIMNDGSVLDEHGDQIYKAGYLDVIKKILKFVEEKNHI
ncbi:MULTISPECIES: gamma-mobile-trio protein GmtX [Acinetobacter calcoaceticus/baumannii complex]|uniref:gamma-mobile-trio protein GmtX n=1 Tax=Acinetobacter calcoaceticus/baumannii complex TaxID=909768 RepID=UPI00244A4D83|nr:MULTISPECIES: gamma-mobile-trio protein GmtX [Acinetobacter calcoaceticus/baumannii complex]MDH2595904.1 gamma-mobile-trio protein GmtX [Acinetobacter baumannii]MDO7536720.1 gamma-mobile-trio protein GmtX [Acinetobacter pittii]